MKRSKFKKKIMQSMQHRYRPLLIGALFLGLTVTLFYKRPVQAASTRGKKAAAILVGGGAGGGIAAIAGSAKWFPLGFGVGGLAGGLIYRGIRKGRERRAAQQRPYASAWQRRRGYRNYAPEYQERYYPMGAYRRPMYRNNKYQ